MWRRIDCPKNPDIAALIRAEKKLVEFSGRSVRTQYFDGALDSSGAFVIGFCVDSGRALEARFTSTIRRTFFSHGC